MIQEKTEAGSDILDIAADTGRLSIPLSQLGHTLSAVDASAKMLEVLKRKDTNRLIKTTHCLDFSRRSFSEIEYFLYLNQLCSVN